MSAPTVRAGDRVFLLPDLGEGLTSADVVEWLVAEGDVVTTDQDVVVVETAKAAVEVPCPYAGTVRILHAAAGTSLDVGQPLITITPDGGEGEGSGAERYRTEERAGATPPDDEGSGAVLIGYGTGHGRVARRRGGRAGGGHVRGADAVATSEQPATTEAEPTAPTQAQAVRVISPLVRRLAAEHGLDLRTLTPGADGVIRRRGVEAALAATPDQRSAAGAAATPTPPPPINAPSGARGIQPDEVVPLTGVRAAIAEKLSRSRREIPDATTWVDVDATEFLAAKRALAAARPDAGIGVLALLARVCVAGLTRYPDLNASVVTDDRGRHAIARHGAVHLGVAVQSPRGLLVPVIRDAHLLNTTGLAARLREVVDAARAGTLTPSDLVGGTFTLNNYGVFGVDGSTPILNHPEAAMLGVGRIIPRPWAHDGQLALREVTQVSFTFDHRVCDGGVAGGFLRYVADCLENPTTLLADV